MSHLFRRQTHLKLRLSVLEIINFKTASLGVYFLVSNFNFSANNFYSIDAEFSINNNNSNNNINSGETMSNQQSSSINFDDLDGLEGQTFEQSSDGSAVVDIAKGLPMECHVLTGFKDYGNPNAQTEISLFFDVEHRLISINNPRSAVAKVFNQRLIQVYQYVVTGFPETVEADFKAYDTANVSDFITLVKLVAKSLKACDTVAQATKLYEGLSGTLFISQWESEEQNPNQYSTAAIVPAHHNVVDAQAVARLDKVVAFHVDEQNNILDKAGRTSRTLLDRAGKPSAQLTRGSAGSWVEGCLLFANTTWGFCLSDKTNTKYAYCADAVQAIGGVSADGMKSLVVADKEGKALARHSMSAHISAQVAEVYEDNLLSEMNGGKFAAHYGHAVNATYIVNSTISSVATGDGGMTLRNPITATINKRLEATFNIALAEMTEDEAREAVLAELAKLTTLVPGQVVEYKEQVILEHTGNLELRVGKIKVSASTYLNTEVVAINFALQCKAEITDYNWKLRGQWLKGITSRNADLQLSVGNESDLIFNANSVKNKKAMLIRLWAHHTGNKIAFCKDGVIRYLSVDTNSNYILGAEVNEAEVQSYINDVMLQEADLTFTAHQHTVNNHRLATPNAFAGATVSEPNTDGNVVVTAKVKVITAPLVVAIELSSVAENLSVGRGVAPITAKFLTTFTDVNDVVINTLGKHSDRVAKMVAASTSTEVGVTLDIYNDSSELTEVLASVLKGRSAYIAFETLKNKFPSGLEITGSAAYGVRTVRPWSIKLHTQLLFANGSFNKAGWSHDSKINNVYSFLQMLASGKRDAKTLNTLADFAYAVGLGLELWREDVVTGKGTLTKATACLTHHGMKVIANSNAGYELHNGQWIPVVLLGETNPLVQTVAKRKAVALDKNGRNVKPLADGDVVLFHRNPLVDLQPAIVRIVGEDVCGAYVAAVAPDAFAMANCGDFDGDAIWLIPGYQMGTRKVLKPTDAKYLPSAKLTALMNHPLVGGKVANQALAVYTGEFDLTEQVLAAQTLGGIIKVSAGNAKLTSTENLIIGKGVSMEYQLSLVAERTTQLADARISLAKPDLTYSEFWCDGAEATANHYRLRVGQGYSIMFNAINSYIDQYHSNGATHRIAAMSREAIAVKAASLYIYEDLGLAGYSYVSEQAFKTLYDLGKGVLGSTKHQPIRHTNCHGFKRAVTNHIAKTEILSMMAAVDFVAMTIIQSRLNRKGTSQSEFNAHSLYRPAVKAAVMRSLTKGLFNSIGNVDTALMFGYVSDSDPYASLLKEVVTAARHNV